MNIAATIRLVALALSIAVIISAFFHYYRRALPIVVMGMAGLAVSAAFLLPRAFGANRWSQITIYQTDDSEIYTSTIQVLLAIGVATFVSHYIARRQVFWPWGIPIGAVFAFAILRISYGFSVA